MSMPRVWADPESGGSGPAPARTWPSRGQQLASRSEKNGEQCHRVGRRGGPDDYAESCANATDLHTIPKSRLRRRRGRLAGAEMASLEQAVRTYLGL